VTNIQFIKLGLLHFTIDSILAWKPGDEVLQGQAHEATSMLYALLNFCWQAHEATSMLYAL